MHKQLVRVGNSLAVVIDKPLRMVLDISEETLLRIYTDGRRIILEPDGVPRAVTPPEELTVRQIVHELIDLHGLDRDHVRVIHAMPKPPFSPMLAVGWSQALAKISSDRDRVIMRRYHACLASRRLGISWEHTLERVVAEYPLAVLTAS